MSMRLIHSLFTVCMSVFVWAQSAESHIRTGTKHYDALEFELAKQEFSAARDLDIQNPVAAFDLGNAYFRLKEYALAAQQFDAVTSLSKDGLLQSRAFFNKGDALLELKDYRGSIDAFKAALRRNPADEDARYNLAYAQQLNNIPIAVCKDTTLFLDQSGSTSIDGTTLDKGSSDDKAIASFQSSKNTFSCEDLGENLVKMIATDNEGNQGFCLSRITIKDTISPRAVCRTDTIRLDSTGVAHVDAKRLDGGSTDNCAIGKHTAQPTTFTELGKHWVTLTVADSSGNSNSCRAQVIVEEYDPEKDKQEQKQEQEQEQEQKEKEEQEKKKEEEQKKQEQEQQDQANNEEKQEQQEGEEGKDGDQEKQQDPSQGGPKDEQENGQQGQGGNDKKEEPAPVGMSKAQAEKLLQSLEQDEKGVQKKVQRAHFNKKSSAKKTDKDW